VTRAGPGEIPVFIPNVATLPPFEAFRANAAFACRLAAAVRAESGATLSITPLGVYGFERVMLVPVPGWPRHRPAFTTSDEDLLQSEKGVVEVLRRAFILCRGPYEARARNPENIAEVAEPFLADFAYEVFRRLTVYHLARIERAIERPRTVYFEYRQLIEPNRERNSSLYGVKSLAEYEDVAAVADEATAHKQRILDRLAACRNEPAARRALLGTDWSARGLFGEADYPAALKKRFDAAHSDITLVIREFRKERNDARRLEVAIIALIAAVLVGAVRLGATVVEWAQRGGELRRERPDCYAQNPSLVAMWRAAVAPDECPPVYQPAKPPVER